MTYTEKPFGELEVGDIVVGIETTEFTAPHTVVKTFVHNGQVQIAHATGGAFWPLRPHYVCRVAA